MYIDVLGGSQQRSSRDRHSLKKLAGPLTQINNMKQLLFIIATFAVLPFAEQLTHAQSFIINRFAIEGGGPSAGGVFTASSTVGQPDAGMMSGGNYSLAGGFWGVLATPPPASTLIEISVGPGLVHLRFNGIPGRTYDIERASSITGPWPPNIQPLATITMPSGGELYYVDTFPAARQFFYRTRLR